MTPPATGDSTGSHEQSRDQSVLQYQVCSMGCWAASTEEQFSPPMLLGSWGHISTTSRRNQRTKNRTCSLLFHCLSTVNNSNGAKRSSWVKRVMGVNRPDCIKRVRGMQKKADCLFIRVSIHLHSRIYSSVYSVVGGLRGSCLVCMQILKWSIRALQWTFHGQIALGLICVLQR